jgi:glycosyltransferase involved in cell wall biosynthesis
LNSTSPTKLIEYLALGLPVVANDHPEQRDVLKSSQAGVCVPWGARYFAKGVTWLAVRGPVVRERMGESGRRWVLAHRTYDRIADELEHQYLKLLSVPNR